MSKQLSILSFFKSKNPNLQHEKKEVEEKKPKKQRTKKPKEIKPTGKGLERFFKITKSDSPEAVARRERIRQQMEEMTEKFRVNNLVEEGPILKKSRKPNR